ncbi:MAG: tetratricopeptide repeat protein [Candidatus Hydrogenedentes bacterium]|nr:tetratricopeptide repeat protein [Candidatus Hydrogenedentota bacterium]
MPTMINCPYCGKLTDPQLDSCVHCGGFLKKQSGQRTARRAGGASQTCTNCGALIQEGDIICVACGTNLLTGQKIADERKQQQLAKAPAQGNNRLYYIVGGILAAAILIGAIALAIAMTSDPIAKAKRLANSGRMLDAIKTLETHTAKNTNDAKAFFELGKLHWLSNNMPQAAQSFEKAVRLDPSNGEATRLAVLSHAQTSSPSSLDAQVTLLSSAVQADSSDAELQYLLGLSRAQKNDVEGQTQALEAARQLEPANAQVQRASAISHALQNDVATAEEQLNTADPSSPDSQAAAGIIASMKGDAADAAKKLQSAISANTSIQNEALTRLGLLLIEQGNFGEALSRLNDASTKDPNNDTARYFRALCMDRQKLTAQALSEYDALSQKPGAYQSRAAVAAARLYLAQQNADRALQILGRVPQPTAGSESAELETVRGRANMMLNDIESAHAAFRKALAADASYAPAHLEVGLLLIQRQDISEGVRELQRYLDLVDENDPDAGVSQVRALVEQLKRSADASKAATQASAAATQNTTSSERGIS